MGTQGIVRRLVLLLLTCGLPACSPSCFLKPTEAFDSEKLAAAPDYTKSQSWAALPSRDDKADFTPPGVEDRQEGAAADVFFVHPTTWMDREVWNDPLDSAKSNEIIEEIILPGQASAFNGCCKIYAPRFRQATIGAYFVEPDVAYDAFSVGLKDVTRAFHTFLERHSDGRPFILAAHSQGSMYAMALLEEIDAEPELRRRMVAAYIPGFAHPMSRYDDVYEHLTPCETPKETGCVAAWDTYSEGTDPDGADPLLYFTDGELARVPLDTPRQCTNPITWRADEKPSPRDAHEGAVQRVNEGEEASFWAMLTSDEPMGLDVTGLAKPRSDLFSARCEGGVLRVPDMDDVGYEAAETSSGNYHLVDYELFYMDIRANAVARVEAWLKQNG